jgi:hypothetical protein
MPGAEPGGGTTVTDEAGCMVASLPPIIYFARQPHPSRTGVIVMRVLFIGGTGNIGKEHLCTLAPHCSHS